MAESNLPVSSKVAWSATSGVGIGVVVSKIVIWYLMDPIYGLGIMFPEDIKGAIDMLLQWALIAIPTFAVGYFVKNQNLPVPELKRQLVEHQAEVAQGG